MELLRGARSDECKRRFFGFVLRAKETEGADVRRPVGCRRLGLLTVSGQGPRPESWWRSGARRLRRGSEGSSRAGSLLLHRARWLRDDWRRTGQAGGTGRWGRSRSRARVWESGAECVQAKVFVVVDPVPPRRGGWRVMR